MAANLLPWHSAQWEQLKRYIEQLRVPQALLITGKPGIGKYQLALQFAETLLCENRTSELFACGKCHSCSLIKSQTHPDFMIVEPEPDDKVLKIDTIRGLLPKLALKPQFEGFRVVLIPAAELMTTACANAFLKCLEEPNERTVIILICVSPRRLPATILSRCQQLPIAEPESSQAIAWLRDQQVSVDHEILLNLAQGSPLRALNYAQEKVVPLRNACFKDWLNIARQQSSPVAVAEQWQKLLPAPLLEWVCSWLTDVIKSHYTAEEKFLFNRDLKGELQVFSKRLDLRCVYALYDTVTETQKKWQENLNKQLLLEVILINWSNLHLRG